MVMKLILQIAFALVGHRKQLNLNPEDGLAAKEHKESKARKIGCLPCLILVHQEDAAVRGQERQVCCSLCVLCVPLWPFQLPFLH
jgi:hypothetical protein